MYNQYCFFGIYLVHLIMLLPSFSARLPSFQVRFPTFTPELGGSSSLFILEILHHNRELFSRLSLLRSKQLPFPQEQNLLGQKLKVTQNHESLKSPYPCLQHDIGIVLLLCYHADSGRQVIP